MHGPVRGCPGIFVDMPHFLPWLETVDHVPKVTVPAAAAAVDSGNRMYIIMTRRMISGLVLKYQKGGAFGHGRALPAPAQPQALVALTEPFQAHATVDTHVP